MPLRAVKPGYLATRQAAQSRVHDSITLPAPISGLDLSQAITNQDPKTAIVLNNFICRRFGVEMRTGSQRWVSNIGSGAPRAQVLSLMTYNPSRGAGSTLVPKLFAGGSDGNIYDVTTQLDESVTPPAMVSIPGQLVPGRYSWTNFATAATNYLCICSAGGGYWTYDDAGGWVNRTANITPVAPATGVPAIDFDFVWNWKNRLWFVANNTTTAYYLGTNAIQGPAEMFDFGPLFVHGGDLYAGASWTVDGGDGIDDKMVVVGRGGDVLIYQGTDPTSASTFQIVGRWYTGRPPFGRRALSKYGGDLAMITEHGIEYMSRLLQAHGLLDPETQPDSPARRFNEVIGTDVRNTSQSSFWQIVHVVSEEGVILLTPHNNKIRGEPYQYFFSALPQGWSRLTGWEAITADEFDGKMFFGTPNGTVLKAFEGTSDDALSDGTVGSQPHYELQSAFVVGKEDRISLKRPMLVQPMFIGTLTPQVLARINTEWSMQPVSGSLPTTAHLVSLWDSAIWDKAVWGGENNTYMPWIGVEGLGVFSSLRLGLRGAPGTMFVGWKLIYESGGIM